LRERLKDNAHQVLSPSYGCSNNGFIILPNLKYKREKVKHNACKVENSLTQMSEDELKKFIENKLDYEVGMNVQRLVRFLIKNHDLCLLKYAMEKSI
jgi:hypothetical protein